MFVPALFLQGQGPGKGKGKGGKATGPPAPSVPHDPHDLNGIWRRSGGVLTMSSDTPPMTPWGKARFDAAKPVYGPRAVPGGLGNDPMSTCDPLGMPRNIFLEVSIYPMELLQTPNRVIQFFEWAHSYRTIWIDGRPLPKDPQPTWLGYSVGTWEGNVLKVDTIGFNDRGWIDTGMGHPQTEALHVIERFRRTDFGHMEIGITIDDPKAYTKPWTASMKAHILPDTELLEMTCENSKGLEHLVGR